MASNKPESWGFQSLAGLLRDLGPREGQRKVYKRLKELDTKISAGEPPDEWRPPGKNCKQERGSGDGPRGELDAMAVDSLQTILKLRQNKPIHKPSDREKECHVKLLNLATKMGNLMKLQEVQVLIDTANYELQMHAHNVTKRLEIWAEAVSAPDCS